MFIRKLKIQNFRCFKDLEIDFTIEKTNRKRTIILGENGTGKSNLLKAIALVTAGSNALGELIGNPNDWIRYRSKSCRIDLFINTQKNQERHVWLEIHRNDTLGSIIKRSDKSLNEIDNAINHADRNYFIAGYGASRAMATSQGRISYHSTTTGYESRRAQCVASLLDRDARLISLEDWAINLDYKNEKRGLKIIKQVFDNFLPGISFHRIDKKNHKLMLKTQDGIVPLSSLSDGYQNMAAWIGDLLFRISNIFSDHKSPLNARGVLLLDELDLHLHPIWQRKLLSFIEDALPNIQLIATTHSPFVAQQANAGELLTIERVKKTLELTTFLGNPKELLIHQIIMSDIFGLETDESVYVQNLKLEREVIKKSSTGKSKKLMDIETQLMNIPKQAKSYTNAISSAEDKSTVKDILQFYGKKMSKDAKA